MKMFPQSVLALLTFLTAGVANAKPPTTFLGIEVGANFTLNECPAETLYGGSKIYQYKPENYPCWTDYSPGTHGPVKDGDFLEFLAKPPTPTGTGTTYVKIQDGKVASVTAFTDGFKHQDLLHQALIDKFGKPSSDKVEKVKAGSGAEFDRIVTTWDSPKVTFTGLSGSINEGQITVYSEDGYRRSVEDASKKQGSF